MLAKPTHNNKQAKGEKMNIETVQRKVGQNKYRRQIGIQVSPHLAEWLRANNISSTALFVQACKELGYEQLSKTESS